jgi:glycosyltransferase involved in cell wall biosynthesis
MAKSILFLSIMDFTDSGIQVVRLTPEYFAKNGWNVYYVVTRDISKNGSYHYQNLVNPLDVTVHRTAMPSSHIGESLKNHVLKTIYSKLRGYLAILKIAWHGHGVLKNHKIDVIYGGGPHGVLAARLLKIICYQKKLFTVSRFYGVWDIYSKNILEHRWFKLLLNFDVLAALYFRADLKIITNDGTQGNKALSWIRPQTLDSFRFYVNGTDKTVLNESELNELRRSLAIENVFTVVCITRLVSIKRIDRCIQVAASVVHKCGMHNFKMLIVGDGVERNRFEKLAHDLGIADNIVFIGAVDNRHVKNYLAISNVFLSMYDVSNVGNPLLEAIRANKIIFTLNNGDTSMWIQHGVNGFIYDVDVGMIDRMAQDMAALAHNSDLQDTIKRNIMITESKMLWSWEERLQVELTEVEKLVEGRV